MSTEDVVAKEDHQFCDIAVDSPFNNSILTYKSLGIFNLFRGQLVSVSLGKRRVKGCVLRPKIEEKEVHHDKDKIKPVEEEDPSKLNLHHEILDLFEWTAKYYHYPLGQHIFDCLPRPLKNPRPLNIYQGKGRSLNFELNSLQKKYVKKIIASSGFQKWLLHGVTGSGKTAIYLSVAKHILESKKSVLFLLPEINLIPQTLKFFQEHCSVPIHTYNNALSNSDKYGLWKHLLNDDTPKIVLGVRSSVFLPLQKIGLIIVDEEHDASFKQEDRCPYHARDIALKRADMIKIPIILGSATPSLETYQAFRESEYYLPIKNRIGLSNLPTIELIDLRQKRGDAYNEETYPFAERSLQEIQEVLNKKEQVLVFVNRLGFAQFIQCRFCGRQFECPNCSVPLKYYKGKNCLKCQYCEYVGSLPSQCPDCYNLNLVQHGYGTEKLADILEKVFPKHKIARFDRDEIGTLTKLNTRLEEFHQGKVDILVGTQMLAKGHNFERVNLVLILGIDGQLNFPDFRSNEKVFQLLTQVSGRSGRFVEKSKVLIQTLIPQNRIFSYIDDSDPFYVDETKVRQLCRCSPFSRMAMLYFISKDNKRASETAQKAALFLKNLQNRYFEHIEILGPRPTFIEKKVGKYTWCLLIRSQNINHLHNSLKTLKNHLDFPRGVTFKLDIDPLCIY